MRVLIDSSVHVLGGDGGGNGHSFEGGETREDMNEDCQRCNSD